ncbi:MAG: serine/threonine protein kinase, partial [Gemmatimonadota bacterium]
MRLVSLDPITTGNHRHEVLSHQAISDPPDHACEGCVTSSVVRMGQVLEDHYLIECRLGGGLLADVYRAHDLRHGRQVAIKVFSSSTTSSIGEQRFLREIQTTARLNHPHLLPVYDSGVTSGLLYYVMPFVAGGSLAALLTTEGRVAIHTTLRIIREVADGLAFAHRRGVVHRDIKPDNVMWSGDHAQIADFGIAKPINGPARSRLSVAGTPLGTPSYMAPEQVMGQDSIDHRADIYSTGILAYELLTGNTLFPHQTLESTMYAQLYEEPAPLRSLRSAIPRSVVNLVNRCIHKDPRRRWQSMTELRDAIDR